MLVSLFSAVPHKPLLEMSGLVNIPPHPILLLLLKLPHLSHSTFLPISLWDNLEKRLTLVDQNKYEEGTLKIF